MSSVEKGLLKINLVFCNCPGNVRQLESLIKRAVLMAEGTIIQPEDLSAEITAAGSHGGIVPFELPPDVINFEEMEKALITKAMERADWVIGKAAPILGLSYKTLQYQVGQTWDRKTGEMGAVGYALLSCLTFWAKLPKI